MEAVVHPEEQEYQPNYNPIRLAWGVLLVAFSVFCMICVASTLGVYFYFFQSSLSLESVLQVGRGTASVRAESAPQEAESGTRRLGGGTTVRTDQIDLLSQALITFHDGRYEEDLIASITLKGDTTVALMHATGPRFDWSQPMYYIELANVFGEVDVLIADDLQRDIQIILRTPDGIEARLNASGRYTLNSTMTVVQLTNWYGRSVLIPSESQTGLSIPEGQRGMLPLDSTEIQLMPSMDQLVSNGELETVISTTDSVTALPGGWSCTNGPPNNPPKGRYVTAIAPDGRPSLRLVRGSGADSMGYSRCIQTLYDEDGDVGVDVSQYDQLYLRATLYVDYQSLSACGTKGSECPLMVKIDYIDDSGRPGGEWIHGIYARLDPVTDYPLRCETCFSDHVFIREKTWYTYNSGNLFNILPPEIRPARVTGIVFYASGHDYDVYLDEVKLLGNTAINVTN